MKLSAPIHVLKGQAKQLKRQKGIPLTTALDLIAQQEGYATWSLLHAKFSNFVPQTNEEVVQSLCPGDLMLIGARPGLGKTRMLLGLLLAASKQKRRCFFFSLEFSETILLEVIDSLEPNFDGFKQYLRWDLSDEIFSQSIISRADEFLQEGSLIAVDYLQLLDQRRTTPPLQQQIEELKVYAHTKKCSIIVSSQIDRGFDPRHGVSPTVKDVRLSNPLDLSLFNKSHFLSEENRFLGAGSAVR